MYINKEARRPFSLSPLDIYILARSYPEPERKTGMHKQTKKRADGVVGRTTRAGVAVEVIKQLHYKFRSIISTKFVRAIKAISYLKFVFVVVVVVIS